MYTFKLIVFSFNKYKKEAISDNKKLKWKNKRQILIKIFNIVTYIMNSIAFNNLFIKFNFLFDQIIIKIDMHMRFFSKL